MTTIKFTKPKKATVSIYTYMTRKAQKAIRAAMNEFSDVDYKELRARMNPSEEEMKKPGYKPAMVSVHEQDALMAVSEAMTNNLVEKIELETGELVENFENFFALTTDSEYSKLAKLISKEVEVTSEASEKKTKE